MQSSASASFPKASVALAFVRRLTATVSFTLPALAFAAFGYSDNGSAYVVDTGAGLVFQVSKSDGTITSIVYEGVEYNGPSGKGSHLSSGLGSATVTPETDGSTYIKLTLQTGTAGTADPNMTQYLVVRNGENTIYMATFPGQEPNVGELRWITRLDHSKLLNGPEPSNLLDTTGPIESQDVFGKPDGTTRSKYYGDQVTHGKERAMDLTYDGAAGTNVGVWMIFGNRESSSGGPFFRDIQNQGGGDQEIYNYMNSGHNQTEPYRLNVLHGPYALVFNHGDAPTYPIDFSWMGSLGLNGWVPASARGAVSGTATGIPAGFQGVVAFANDAAQYWAVVNPGDGSYTCSGMKPGDYAVTLYKGELGVATSTVTVSAGATTTLDLASTEPTPSVIFRIGDWDGTPAGLLNADNIPQMHPSDVRNAAWGPVTYNVGSDTPAGFPAIQTRLANDGNVLRFTLAPNQVTNLTLRIGITCSYPKGGGRPVITVNNGATSAAPAASTQPDSRSFTIGTYRGNNVLYEYPISAAQLVAGSNTIRINVASGSTDSGTWLSAGWVYDAIELDGPIAAPTITYAGSDPLAVSGTSEAGRNIAVTLDGATPAGTTVASAAGQWSVTYSGVLASGPHTLTAVASDDAGHSSPASAPFTFNSAIAMPVITQAVGDTGTYSNGATTSDRVFVFQGTASAGDTVKVTRVGVGPIGSVVADASGSWSFDYTNVTLPDGTNSFYATASNVAGSSASSPVFSLNLQGAPRVSIERYNPAAQVITAGFGSVVFRVTFNTTVSGVSTNSFAVVTTNTAAGSVASVSANSGTVFDVTVGGLSGTGDLHLNLAANNGIVDSNNHPEGPYTAGEFYTLVNPSTGNGVWTQPVSGGRWGDPRNWLNAVVADGAGTSADFSTLDLTADNLVHLDASRTVGALMFGDSDASTPANWLVDNNGNGANTLTLAGGTPTITVNPLGSGATATLTTGLAGSAGFNKTGAGTLVLAGANAMSGAITVTAGTIQIAPGGSHSATNVTLAAPSGTLDVVGGTFTSSGTATANGGGGRLIVDAGVANFAAVATNNSSGGLIRVNGGTFNAASINIPRSSDANPSFGSGFIVAGGSANVSGTVGVGTNNSWGSMSVEGGSLTVGGAITLGNQATSGRGGQLRVIGNATLTSTDTAAGLIMSQRSNNNSVAQFTGGMSTFEKITMGFNSSVNAGNATLTVNGGTLYLGSGGIVKNGTGTFAATLNLSSGIVGAKASWSTALPLNLPGGGNFTFKAADAADHPHDILLTGVVGGAGGFTKIGAGTLTLDGAATHTFAGTVNVNGGALRIASTLASASSPVNVNDGGVLTGNGVVNRAISLNAGGTLAPDGPTPAATLTGTTLTWNDSGTMAIDLGESGVSDVLALSGTLTKGTPGTYTFAFTPGTGFAAGNTYTLATYASCDFDAHDFTATGLPTGTGALFQVRDTSLQLRIQARPNVTSPTVVNGTFAQPLSYTATADDLPATFGASNLPPGLSIDPVSGVVSGTPTAAGVYSAMVTATNTAGSGFAVVQFNIVKAVAVISVGTPANATVRRTYDGTPQAAPITTDPAGLNATFTYNGSSTPPTLPGTYEVVATIADANYSGTATGQLVIGITALVRHAPVIDGDLDGSFQMLAGENLTLNGGTVVSGDMLVPGMPTVRLNGHPTLVDTHDESGRATPGNYTVTLNGSAMARYLVRRVNPIAMPIVTAPAAPSGTRDVVLNSNRDVLGDPATIRDLTLNGNVGVVALPPGAYRNVAANSGGFILGDANATEPVVYDLQRLTLNGEARIEIVGPVVLRLANGLTFNGSVGNASDPSLLTLEVFNGGVTLNGDATLAGTITAPNGSVIINGRATVHGSVTADRLTINGNGALVQP